GDRYANASELDADLGRFLRGEPTQARPAGPLERAAKVMRRYPTVSTLVASVVLVTFAGLTGISWAYGVALHEWGKTQAEKRRADDNAKDATANEKSALKQRDLAIAQTEKALQQWWRAEQLLYAAQFREANQAYQTGDYGFAYEALQECRWD